MWNSTEPAVVKGLLLRESGMDAVSFTMTVARRSTEFTREPFENDSLRPSHVTCSSSDGTEEVSCFAVKLRQAGQIRDRSGQASVEWDEEADSRRIRQPFRAIGLASVPVALGVPLEGAGEFRIALAAPDGALGEIDAASQIGEPCGARDGVEGGQDGGQRQCQVEGNWNAVVRQDQWPERREILEARPGEEDARADKCGAEAGADTPGLHGGVLELDRGRVPLGRTP